MANWIDEQVAKQRFADMVRTVERDSQANAMLAVRRARTRFYNPLLARLGRRLVMWGYGLQLRYGPLSDTPISSKARSSATRW
jgi:hypothetical protein